jgi:DNA-binding NarL/FixJ family response regulator
MDLQMPTLNGIEAIIGIRSEFPNARIIVLTKKRSALDSPPASVRGVMNPPRPTRA